MTVLCFPADSYDLASLHSRFIAWSVPCRTVYDFTPYLPEAVCLLVTPTLFVGVSGALAISEPFKFFSAPVK